MARPTRGHHQGRDLEASFRAKSRQVRRRSDKVRTRLKAGKALPENALQGVVVTSAGPYWVVTPAGGAEAVICTVSGTVDSPETDTIVTVGDVVWIVPQEEVTEFGDPVGVIVKREERRTLLSRRAAGRARREQVVVANVDQLAIVVAAREPVYNKRLIDRPPSVPNSSKTLQRTGMTWTCRSCSYRPRQGRASTDCARSSMRVQRYSVDRRVWGSPA